MNYSFTNLTALLLINQLHLDPIDGTLLKLNYKIELYVRFSTMRDGHHVFINKCRGQQ